MTLAALDANKQRGRPTSSEVQLKELGLELIDCPELPSVPFDEFSQIQDDYLQKRLWCRWRLLEIDAFDDVDAIDPDVAMNEFCAELLDVWSDFLGRGEEMEIVNRNAAVVRT